MFDGFLPTYIVDYVESIPQYVAFKWLAISFVSVALIALLSFEQRRLNSYYQRLASHASIGDSQTVEYVIQLLSVSSRNKLLFSISLLILAFSLIFYDIKQQAIAPSAYTEVSTEEVIQQTDVTPEQNEQAEPPQENVTPKVAAIPSMRAMRKRYVHWLSSYYILEHCQRAKEPMRVAIEREISNRYDNRVDMKTILDSINNEAKGEVAVIKDNFDCSNYVVNVLATQAQTITELK